MVVPLSHELRQALAAHPGEPFELVDGLSGGRYVVVSADQYARVSALLTSEEFSVAETYAAQSEALAKAGWNDPELDAYDDYDAHRS